MYELSHFDVVSMAHCAGSLRVIGGNATYMEEAAQRLVELLRKTLVDERGDPACALIRFYKTHPFGGLPAGPRRAAEALLGGVEPWPEMKCLTLLASTGDEPAWCSTETSVGHRAIPLPSVELVERAPMIRALMGQLGVDLASVVEPDPRLVLDLEQRNFNVFHVPEPLGDPTIPAQDFVVSHGIRAVIGFGGMLLDGNLFAVVMFSKVPVERDEAERFSTLAVSVKLALHPFARGRVFAPCSKS